MVETASLPLKIEYLTISIHSLLFESSINPGKYLPEIEALMPELKFHFFIPFQKESPMTENGDINIIQTLTVDQIHQVSKKVGLTEQSVTEMVNLMSRNDFLTLGLVDLTTDVAIGWAICEMYYAGEA